MSDSFPNAESDEQERAPAQSYGWLALRRKAGQITRRVLAKPVYKIGREIGNDLVLPDPSISRQHARILCSLAGCQIEDMGSRNKTYLNDEDLPPHEPRPLIDGDVIRIGEYTLVYHTPELEIEPEPEEAEIALTFPEAPLPPKVPSLPLAWPLPPRSSYLQYMPSFFSRSSLMDRFLLIFESILAPVEQIVDHIPLILDPRTMPAELLPWVASWLDLTLNENWPESRRRDLIRAASELYRWRGTRQGLSHYLEIYAGVTPELDDQLEEAHTFRVTLHVPADQPVDEALVRAIIEAEKPAHTAYELHIEWGQPQDDDG